jgi:hypothetical protein
VIALALAAWQVRPARPEPSITFGWINKDGEICMSSSQRDEDGDYDDDDDDDDLVYPPSHEASLVGPEIRLYASDEDHDDDDGTSFLKRLLQS